MTDATTDGFADTPGPDATPEQEEHVRALLAFLRDEPVPMPEDVVRRLDAVLAEERRSGSRPSAGAPGGAGPQADAASPSGTVVAPVTVLPTAAHRPSRSTRTLRVLGGLAAAAVVVVGAVSVSGALRGGGSASLASGESAAAPSSASTTRITATGASYTAATLRTQATELVAATRGAVANSTFDAAAAPAANGPVASPTGAPLPSTVTALSPTAAAGCVRQLTQGDGSVALVVDTGRYDGQPALVVVIPTPGDRSTLDVWVVKPTCSATSADLLEFQRIPAP